MVQVSPSSGQGTPSFLVSPLCTQPNDGLQLSAVHGLSSLQLRTPLPTHCDSLHLSCKVHGLLSLQGSLLEVKRQPPAGSHLFSVQGLASSQTLYSPPTHLPAAHLSVPVQALPSSQGVP